MNEESDRSKDPQKVDREKTYAILQWLNRNRQMLLNSYKNQYVAHNENRLIAHSDKLQEVIELADASGEQYFIYLVPKRTSSIQILPIYFRSVVRHDWQPNYPVSLKHKEQLITVEMLVDSGAEVSLITNKLGNDLGYALADAESTLLAETVGGTVEYVLRNIEMTIDGYDFIAPVAWLQTEINTEQLLLGREVVFDRFNIEFRQAEEKIIFTWRDG